MVNPAVETIEHLVEVAIRLGGLDDVSLSSGERVLAKRSKPVSVSCVRAFRDSMRQGDDPLGQNFSRLKSAAARRPLGATYTPKPLVTVMSQWVAEQVPQRVIDPGAGSGRFLVDAGRRLPKAHLVGIEMDPLAALMLRAHLKVAGLAKRSEVIVGDYCSARLPRIDGVTAYLGNPPYVRHHGIAPERKVWFAEAARELGLPASKLAGLHLYFYVTTSRNSQSGDIGAFLTASEWMDVNYGEFLRRLLLERLGLCSLHVLDPAAKPFDDADTTAVVACFQVGQRHQNIRIRRAKAVDDIGSLNDGRPLTRTRFEACARWSTLLHTQRRKPAGFIELGELCQVHRGQVTGNNRIWIAGAHSSVLPEQFLFATVTRARDLFAAGPELAHAGNLRCVIDIPANLDDVPRALRSEVEKFLKYARGMGAAQGYVATHRRAWWSVGLREPAPILASYMARRAPAFVVNGARARHINIAHGIYPREAMPKQSLGVLVEYLRRSVSPEDGRMYSGGLAKFEPKEMERLLIPGPSLLLASSNCG